MRIPLPSHGPDRHWSPILFEERRSRRPEPGMLIALNRQPVRVVSITEIDPLNWDDNANQAYEREKRQWEAAGKPAPSREEWRDRPYGIRVRPAAAPAPINDNDGTVSYTGRPYRTNGSPSWAVLPEHYAVCATCGELSPCNHLIAERESARQAEILEKRLSVMPGCCWACREPITKRMKSITFDGPNLDILIGPSPVTFHLRSDCWHSAARYEEKWVAADPARRLTLRCPGWLTVHLDAPECSEGPLCIGETLPHGKGWSDHTAYVRHPELSVKFFAYIAERGLDDMARKRGLYECLRCIDEFGRRYDERGNKRQ